MLPLSFAKLESVAPVGHAEGGVFQIARRTLSLPTLATPAFAVFGSLGRAMRVVLPLGNGGWKSDPDKLALTDQVSLRYSVKLRSAVPAGLSSWLVTSTLTGHPLTRQRYI